jgi:hypothetical protein
MTDENYQRDAISEFLQRRHGEEAVAEKAREKGLAIRRGENPCVIYAIFLIKNGVKINVNKNGEAVLEGVRTTGRTSPRSMSPERRVSPERRTSPVRRLPSAATAPSARRLAASPPQAAAGSARPSYAGGCNSGCGIGTPYRSMSPPRYVTGHNARNDYTGGNWGKTDYTGSHTYEYGSGARGASPTRRFY